MPSAAWILLKKAASSSCRMAESTNMMGRRSAVASVQWMAPGEPLLDKKRKAPAWSMCAWVTKTARIVGGSAGKFLDFSRASRRWPWKIPQSSRTRASPSSTRCRDPVTSSTPPLKRGRSLRGVRHAAARRCRTASKTAGRIEMKMMARMTNVKLFLTTGRLPKKYPANRHRPTHNTPPAAL